ncbi:MAG: universal stress protein [Desulfobacteraceae bacterium]|jgi:nucleotide-binding universal stress UspA family protein
MLLFRKILCPTDFSEPSYMALNAADDLAKEFRSELIILHVISPIQAFPTAPGFAPGQPAASGYIATQVPAEVDGQATESLNLTLKEKISGDVKAKTELLHGNPAEEIARYAEESNTSVIIMGTHGFTGWRHLLLGSVTEKVVRLSTCPVITIPAHEEK